MGNDTDKDFHLTNLENIFMGNDFEAQQVNLIIEESIPESAELPLSSVVNVATEASNTLIKDSIEDELKTKVNTQSKVGTQVLGLYDLSDGIITVRQNNDDNRRSNQI